MCHAPAHSFWGRPPRFSACWSAVIICLLLLGCTDEEARPDQRTVIYWEKWTDFEGAAADALVDAFNQRQQQRARNDENYVPIHVKKVTISRIDQKLLVAIAGGNPPDVAGVYSRMVPAYADKGALTDLSDWIAEAGIEPDDYIPVFWKMGHYRDRTWALPTTPASLALHWNKRLLEEAGLDAERGPRTIEELDDWAARLTKWEVTEEDGSTRIVSGYTPHIPVGRKRLLQAGFLPNEPGWWDYAWGYFFGGSLVEDGKISSDHPGNERAYEWVASYSEQFGVDAMQRFRSGFGNFSSPQNPFLSGRIAMQLQGVWMYNFVQKFAPGMRWGAGPFPHPADRPDLAGTTIVEADSLVIPTGAKRPKEAFEFMKFANSREGMELLCMGQRKFSPLATVSDSFWSEHPHPRIRLFHDLATGKNARSLPALSIWNRYQREMVSASDSIQNLSIPVDEALETVQKRVSKAYARDRAILERRYGNVAD